MSGGAAVRVRFEPVRSLSYTLISNTYYPVGTELANPARCVYLFNNTDRALTFSFDGIYDHIVLPSFGYWFFDIASNQAHGQGFFMAEGDRLYTKTPTTNPTSGLVYFTVMYGQKN